MNPRPVIVRLARPLEAGDIALMCRDLIERGLGWSWTRAKVAKNMANRDITTLAACDGKQLVGFAMMYFGDDHAHLNLLAVKTSYQRSGLGRRLVAWLEESARCAGISAIHLEVRANNTTGRRFYRALGFQEVALLPRYYRGVESAIWMARDLRSRAAQQRVQGPQST
jgi:ribosomal-protein-alanine acetyltransferase